MLNTALDRLHKSLWFGLMERMDESLELFRYQTGLKIQMKHFNKNRYNSAGSKSNQKSNFTTSQNTYPDPTKDNIRKLKNLMPIDLFLYEYAKQLFEIRWQKYLSIKYGNKTSSALRRVQLKLPDRIDGCKSTSKYLNCPDNMYHYNTKSNV